MLGIGFTCAGMWIKTLINISAYFLLVGNTLGGIGQPFFLNASALLAATWFSEGSRALVTTVASMANNLGNIFGSLFPTFFVKSEDPTEIRS